MASTHPKSRHAEQSGRPLPAAGALCRRRAVVQTRAGDPREVAACGHPDCAQSLNNLATLYEKQGRHADSEPLFQRALAIYEKAAGPAHPAVATLLNNLGQVDKVQGRYGDAEPLIMRSLAIREKQLGPDHPDVARSLNNLADLYERQRRYAEAEPLYRRALAIRDRALGADHPDVAIALNNLAVLYQAEGRTADALPMVQRTIVSGRAQPRVALAVLSSAQQQQLIAAGAALDGALNVIQRAAPIIGRAAVNKLAVRLAAGNDRLAQLVRRDQDLAAEAEALDKSIIAAVSSDASKRDAAAEQRSRHRIAAVATERAALQKTFATEFPDYAALSNPLPMTVKEIQRLLAADEAMVLFSVADEESYVSLYADSATGSRCRSAPKRCRRSRRVPPWPGCRKLGEAAETSAPAVRSDARQRALRGSLRRSRRWSRTSAR